MKKQEAKEIINNMIYNIHNSGDIELIKQAHQAVDLIPEDEEVVLRKVKTASEVLDLTEKLKKIF